MGHFYLAPTQIRKVPFEIFPSIATRVLSPKEVSSTEAEVLPI